MESRRIVLKNLFTGQQWRNRHRGKTYEHGERGGEGEMYGKSNMETYITICKIDSQREFAVWLRKLKRALYQPRWVGWGGRWEGGSKGRGYMYTCGWFMLRFDKKQQNSVKQFSFNKKNFKPIKLFTNGLKNCLIHSKYLNTNIPAYIYFCHSAHYLSVKIF